MGGARTITGDLYDIIGNPTAYSVVVLILAMTQGALLGLEREKAKIETSPEETIKGEFPGLRTFGLMSLLGSIVGYLYAGYYYFPEFLSKIILFFSTVFIVVIVTFFMYYRMFREGFIGITSYIVMFIAFSVGVLTGMGYIIFALAVTFLTAGLLAMKRFVLKMMEQLSYEEFIAGLELGIIVFILGPLAFSTNYQFFGISFKGAYIFFVLILAISYNSYLIYKIKGAKSIEIISLLGGLVNSEATLLNISRIIREGSILGNFITWINTGLIIRSFLLTVLGAYPFLSYEQYLAFLWIVVPAYIAVFLTLALMFRLSKSIREEELKEAVSLKSPLEFSTAIRGALIYVLLILLSKIISKALGNYALLGLSFAGGLASAGATIFSLLSLSSTIDPQIIGLGSILAVIGGLVNKPFYARAVSDREGVKYVSMYTLPLAIVFIVFSVLMLWLS